MEIAKFGTLMHEKDPKQSICDIRVPQSYERDKRFKLKSI